MNVLKGETFAWVVCVKNRSPAWHICGSFKAAEEKRQEMSNPDKFEVRMVIYSDRRERFVDTLPRY